MDGRMWTTMRCNRLLGTSGTVTNPGRFRQPENKLYKMISQIMTRKQNNSHTTLIDRSDYAVNINYDTVAQQQMVNRTTIECVRHRTITTSRPDCRLTVYHFHL